MAADVVEGHVKGIDYSKWDHLVCSSDEDQSAEGEEDEEDEEEEVTEHHAGCEEYVKYEEYSNGVEDELFEAEEEEEDGKTNRGNEEDEDYVESCLVGSVNARRKEQEEEDNDKGEDVITSAEDGESNRAACLAYLEDANLAISQAFEAGTKRASGADRLSKALAQQEELCKSQSLAFVQHLQALPNDSDELTKDKAALITQLITQWRDELIANVARLSRGWETADCG